MSDHIDLSKLYKAGKCGRYSVEHFRLTEHEVKMETMRAAIHHRSDEVMGLSWKVMYTRLVRDEHDIVMSNTPMEMRTNYAIMHRAFGNVLIAGLGLGMILIPISRLLNVRRIVVVEKDADVLKLMQPRLERHLAARTTFINLDIFDAKQYILEHYEEPFDTIYFDIWDEISGDNWAQMKKLKNRYRPLLRKTISTFGTRSWISCWREMDCRVKASRDRADAVNVRSILGGPITANEFDTADSKGNAL